MMCHQSIISNQGSESICGVLQADTGLRVLLSRSLVLAAKIFLYKLAEVKVAAHLKSKAQGCMLCQLVGHLVPNRKGSLHRSHVL